MKFWTSVALVFAACPVFAQSCEGVCSATQKAIWDEFLVGHYSTEATPALYRGECFHSGPSYSADTLAHGTAYFFRVDSNIYYDGSFEFGGPPDAISYAEAARKFTSRNPNNQVQIKDGSGQVDMVSPGHDFRYAFRQTAVPGELLLVGRWDEHHDVFCRLKKQAPDASGDVQK